MKIFLALALATACLCVPAVAASNQAGCKLLGEAFPNMTAPMRDLLQALQTTEMQADVLSQFEGDELAALQKVEQARLALTPVLEAYVTTAEDAGYQMQVCQR